ncbi:long-chain-fatty-acid--CoA ligase [Solirubrobacter soli]|uniref:long-chain-fatty-acid--CoA ligase n=1 Tax=Solirubrobacter soli TaxID=363832 RepID=UPI00041BA754|nr:long-chain fatty acid--CoA ligase [Solirubrobacter soli]
MPNLAHLLSATHRDRVAIQLDRTELTYGALDAAAAQVAGLLRAKGVAPGDRVAIMLPNTPHFAVTYYGALRAGAVIVPMNVLLKQREVAFYLRDSGAKVLFAWHEFAEAAHAGAEAADAEVVLVEPGQLEALLARCEPAEAVVERADDDTAVILYTSGTTGTPKGAELTHGNLARNVAASIELFGTGEHTVALGALPFFHAFGQTCALNTTIAVGGRLTLLPRFDAGKALEIIERDAVTTFLGVPTMYAAMLHHPGEHDTSSLTVCVSGGAAMPVEVMRAFEERFGCAVLEGYGLSETSPVASFNRRDRERKPGTIGLPIAGIELRVADDGELLIRGHNVMKGYWNRPEATAEAIDADGWFHSGDIARVDDDGYFAIVDRKKEVVIRGGFNVYPREIEEVIYEHPAVLEAAVIGVPHDTLGEEVGAAIALKPGATATAGELRDYVKQRVAAYKYPRHVWFVDALPKGPTGKILKREIEIPEAVHA